MFGVAMMVFPFLPASNLFFPVGFVVAERVLYLPSMGFCMLVAMGVWQLIRRNPAIIKMGVFYLLVVHSGKTLVRNRDWFSSQTLFQSAIVQFPNNAKMYNNLAVQYDEANNKSLAAHFFTQSMKVEPHFITAYSNLAYLLRNQSDMQGALKVSLYVCVLICRVYVCVLGCTMAPLNEGHIKIVLYREVVLFLEGPLQRGCPLLGGSFLERLSSSWRVLYREVVLFLEGPF